MKYCAKCRVQVRGERGRCPLCNAVLEGKAVPSGFPRLPDHRRARRLWLSLLALASVAASVICLLLNFQFRARGLWSLFVLGGVLCMWIMLGIALHKKRNVPKTLVWETFLVSALSVLWDAFTGWRGWSIDFVIPIVCMGAMVALVVLFRLLRVSSGSFIVYLLVDALLGILQLALLLTGLVTVVLPSLLCIGCSIILLAVLLIFRGRNVGDELERRLHL